MHYLIAKKGERGLLELAVIENLVLSMLCSSSGSGISYEVKKLVQEFMLRDDIIRQASGRKDCITVKDNEGSVSKK